MVKFLFSVVILTLIATKSIAASHTYKMGKMELEGYIIDKGKNAPLVIIVHDWDGLDDYEVKRAKMLSDLGYSVFALDMFGKGVRPESVEKRKELTGALYKDRKKMRNLMNAALKEAKRKGLNTKKAAVVGYCFGGTSVLEWAKSGADLDGFISFHGGLKVNEGDSYKKTKSKIMVFHGTADSAVSMKDFADLAMLLEKENVPHEMITYSGAPHAFTKFGSDRYREYADKKSWERFSEFLKEQL